MKNKIYVLTFTAVSLLLIVVNAFINYKYDLYAVFDKDFTKPRYVFVNERYAKMDYLLHDGKRKYDTFIFGSSRAWGINPKQISNKAYNLCYSAGLPSDFLRDLKTLVNNDIKIKKIFLSLDEFHYKRLPEEVNSSVNFVGYGSDIENLKYKASLLLKCPNKDTIKYVMGRLDSPKQVYNFTDDGTMHSEESSANIKEKVDWASYVADARFNKPTYHSEKNNRTDKTIAEIKEFKDICDKNGIELVVYMTPTHIATYLSDDINSLNNFKRQLAAITYFWDFSVINHVTTNNYYWMETSHVNENVLAEVISVVTGRSSNICDNFGVYVNKQNIEQHLVNMKTEREQYLLSPHVQYVPKESEQY